MSKISKFIICFMVLIISVCSIVVPTYCADISSSLFTIDLVNEFPNYNNYYNTNNITYVTYKNFDITRSLGNILYGTNVSDIPSNFSNGQIFTDNYTRTINGIDLFVESEYTLSISSSSYTLSCTKFNITNIEDLEFTLSPSVNSIPLDFRWCPTSFLTGINNRVNNMHLYGRFFFKFDIDYNGQYFYNDTFCMTANLSFNKSLSDMELGGTNVRKEFILTDNFGDVYNGSIPLSSSNFYNKYLFFNNLLYTDRYITNVNCSIACTNIFLGNQTALNFLYSGLTLKYVDYEETKSINLYSGSTTGSGGAVGSLIPNGSNNFYKTAEWWDIPSHLYNFFIYLIMDAPIVSYFTKLGMFIINFIVESFSFIISLFNGVSNVFFISIFVGILALIFLLKIIFGGKS